MWHTAMVGLMTANEIRHELTGSQLGLADLPLPAPGQHEPLPPRLEILPEIIDSAEQFK